MRYYIRHNALRLGTGESAPWVVEDELVKKFSLPSKFSDFLLDPHKVQYQIVSEDVKCSWIMGLCIGYCRAVVRFMIVLVL